MVYTVCHQSLIAKLFFVISCKIVFSILQLDLPVLALLTLNNFCLLLSRKTLQPSVLVTKEQLCSCSLGCLLNSCTKQEFSTEYRLINRVTHFHTLLEEVSVYLRFCLHVFNHSPSFPCCISSSKMFFVLLCI